jgi:hypothetical protein
VAKDLDFRTAEMIQQDSEFVKSWFAAAAVLAAERPRLAKGLKRSLDYRFSRFPAEDRALFFAGRPGPPSGIRQRANGALPSTTQAAEARTGEFRRPHLRLVFGAKRGI